MRKADLADAIAEETGLDKKDVSEMVESFMSVIKKTLSKNEGVYLRSFGTFGAKTKKAKIGRDIAKGVALPIAAHSAPFFKPAKEFKELVSRKVKVAQ